MRETIEQQQERHEETVREDKNNQCGGEVLPGWAVHQLEYYDQILNRICSKIGMDENWRRDAGGGFSQFREKLLVVEQYVVNKEVMREF